MQLTVIVMLVSIGDTILVLPSMISSIAERNAWISALISICIGPAVCLLFASLQSRFPGMTPVQISRAVLGKWMGNVAAFLFVFGFVFLMVPMLMRELGDFMTTQIMPNTPIEIVYFLFLVIVVRGVRSGLEPLARSAEIFAPWVLMLSVLLVIFVLPDIRLYRIEPLFYQGLAPVLGGAYPFVAFSYFEVGILMMIFPYVKEPKKIRSNLLIGTLLSGLLLSSVIFLCLTVFGPNVTADLMYPSYLLARKIEIGEFLQRIEVIMAIIWLFTIYFKMSLCLYGTCLGAAQLFHLRDMKLFAFPLALISMVIADRSAPNITAFTHIISGAYPLFDFTFAVLLPVLLLAVGALRKTPAKAQVGSG
nr:endospore germination permease [Paenibacillus soyae]